MASIRQTIPAYSAGISEQPDHLKFPGQLKNIVNGVPDITKGLFKRPGAARVGTTPLSSVQSGGSWFHYFRDENEGSYIGQVDSSGNVRIWKASGQNAGAPQTVVYGTGGTVACKAYLATPSNNPEALQFLTINDTTFVTNRDINNPLTAIRDSFEATYQQSGTTVTISYGFHELTPGYALDITFTGAAAGDSGEYLAVTTPNSNAANGTITVTLPNSSSRNVTSDTACTVTPLTPARPEPHFAFVDILRTENGRQYGLNIFNSDTTTAVERATKIEVLTSTFDEADGTGHCPGIGTAVFTVNKASGDGSGLGTGNGRALTFRFSALGQQGVSPNYVAAAEGPGGQNYRAAYSLEVTLLHGGEGWQVGDQVVISPPFAGEAANVTYDVNATPRSSGSQATATIKVLETETVNVKATVNSPADGLIRPMPTPFDADTAVTADAILGQLTTGLPTGISAKVIGTGVYYSSNNPFNVEVVEEDLMRVMQTSVNDVSRLPNQCRHGCIVKIANARLAEEDDYYLRFNGQNDRDGAGSWSECAAPNIPRRLFNMPLAIQRTGLANPGASNEIATFTVGRFPYQDRLVGDNGTNPYPSFMTAKGVQTSNQLLDAARINKVIFFRNRLAILSGENVILSRPGTFGTPDFFIESALTVGAADPIDISASSMFPSEIFDAIEINSGLVVFSSNQQFLLSTDSEILNPETAKLRSVSTFNYNIKIPPISLGTTIAYLDSSGKFSRFNEMANIAREGEPNVVEQSKIVPSLIPKQVDLLTNSRDNAIVLIGKTNEDTVFGYKYFNVGEKREQQSWFKWQFNRKLRYHFVINDEYYFLDEDHFLQKINLVQADTDLFIEQDNVNYLLHIDNYVSVSGGIHNPTTGLTQFTNQSDWIDQVGTGNGTLVVIDDSNAATRIGRYAKCTVINNDDFTIPGNWQGDTLKIGYLYDFKAEFPRIYPTKVEGERSFADVNSSVVVHRIKVHFGKIGLYETTLTRKGKPDYSEVYESVILNEYDVSDAPYLSEYIKTIPIYERNTNVDITLKSSHPAPAILRAMSWEGDYTPRFYKRV